MLVRREASEPTRTAWGQVETEAVTEGTGQSMGPLADREAVECALEKFGFPKALRNRNERGRWGPWQKCAASGLSPTGHWGPCAFLHLECTLHFFWQN